LVLIQLYYFSCCPFTPLSMAIAQIKNLQRRLANLEEEASAELTRVCGHGLWQTLGFDALDSLEDPERRARANYYYGQLQTVRELQEALT
jgi:hypothetical protein